ncbi:MAG TPA: porin, partial [Verrucomicrobiae bacterium]|nr:porin [Verrucomicrobiae bacterium]
MIPVLMRSRAGWRGPLVLSLALCAAAGSAAAQAADTAAAAHAPAVPFAFADFSWVPGNAGASERPLTAGPFTGEFRLDDVYHWSFNDPSDGTISGSSEVFRHGEFQVTQLGIGGDLLY